MTVEVSELVSIAISTYEANGKGSFMLEYSIQKILTQTYPNIEIVVSDHSRDDCIKSVCEKFSNSNIPIKYCHYPHNLGNSSANTNNAINNCSGKYIKVLFMDDFLLEKTAIEQIVNEFHKKKEKKWLVHSYTHTNNYKELYRNHTPSLSSDIALVNKIGCPSCLSFSSEVKLRFDENLKWFMDSEFYWRLYKSYGYPIIMHVPDNTTAFVVQLLHNGQVTNTQITNKLIEKERKYIRTLQNN